MDVFVTSIYILKFYGHHLSKILLLRGLEYIVNIGSKESYRNKFNESSYVSTFLSIGSFWSMYYWDNIRSVKKV